MTGVARGSGVLEEEKTNNKKGNKETEEEEADSLHRWGKRQ